MAALASAVAVIPAMLRVGSSLEAGAPAAPAVWTALVAVELVPMVLAVLVLRQARVGVRAFSGPAWPVRVLGVVIWALSMFFVLSVLGHLLAPPRTHHMALAGATFALIGLVAAIGSGIVCARLVGIVSGWSDRGRRITVIATSVAAAGALAFFAFRFARAFSGSAATSSGVGEMLIDGLAFAITALFASRWEFTDRRVLAYAGVPAAAVLLTIGITTLRGSDVLIDVISERAPGFGLIVGLFSSH
jgi:hypothetical protein